tara:strand:- start:714 stop:1511 length:798 start_codon:yes stop_codon:yes gene_type:complete
MAHYLRDEQLFNITIDGDVIAQVIDVFMSRQVSMPENNDSPADPSQPATHLSFTIRFDGKGYRVFSLDSLLQHFKQATDVERVIFDLDSSKSIKSNKSVGSYLELKLDKNENATSFLSVASDDEDWTNNTFVAVKEVVNRARNRNGLVRNPWTGLLIQVIGLLIGFLASLWGASIISPSLTIENAFLISFLLVLLLFSNMWTHIYQWLNKIVSRVYPIIRFYRPNKDRLHWLYQTVLGGIVVAVALFFLNKTFSYAGKLLGAFIN